MRPDAASPRALRCRTTVRTAQLVIVSPSHHSHIMLDKGRYGARSLVIMSPSPISQGMPLAPLGLTLCAAWSS